MNEYSKCHRWSSAKLFSIKKRKSSISSSIKKTMTHLDSQCDGVRQHGQRMAQNVEQRDSDECLVRREDVVRRKEDVRGEARKGHEKRRHEPVERGDGFQSRCFLQLSQFLFTDLQDLLLEWFLPCVQLEHLDAIQYFRDHLDSGVFMFHLAHLKRYNMSRNSHQHIHKKITQPNNQ